MWLCSKGIRETSHDHRICALTSRKVPSVVFPWTIGKGLRPSVNRHNTLQTVVLKQNPVLMTDSQWIQKERQNSFKHLLCQAILCALPSSYNCPPTFTNAMKCKSTFSSKLGAWKTMSQFLKGSSEATHPPLFVWPSVSVSQQNLPTSKKKLNR